MLIHERLILQLFLSDFEIPKSQIVSFVFKSINNKVIYSELSNNIKSIFFLMFIGYTIAT